MKSNVLIALSALVLTTMAGCGNDKITSAVAKMQPTQGNEVQGQIRFKQEDRGIRILAEVSGLTPGKHGFHIHQYGDCTAADGKSAGGHFNPEKYPHAGPNDAHRHMGDLGNIMADENGVGVLDVIDPKLTFEGAKSIIGRGVIIHAKPDDLSSQPTGFAGPREACGVIGIAK